MKHTYKGIPIKKVIVETYKCTGCIFEKGTDCIMSGIEELSNLPCYHDVDGVRKQIIWIYDQD